MSGFLKFLLNVAAVLIFIQWLPSLITGVKQTYHHFASSKSKVGIVCMNQVIMDADCHRCSLKKFFKDPSIKAILLKIDSGGGAAGTSQALFLDIEEFKKEYPKPIITFVEKMCASGAYNVAIATDSIVATPAAFIGSIGVYIAYPIIKELMDHYKVKYNIVKTGQYKTIGSMFNETNADQTALLQGITNDTYQQFIGDVSKKRPLLHIEKANEWAEGKIFTGKQALALGLIDHVGSLATAEKVLREKAGIENEIEWVVAESKNPIERMFNPCHDTDEQVARLTKVLSGALNNVRAQLQNEQTTVMS